MLKYYTVNARLISIKESPYGRYNRHILVVLDAGGLVEGVIKNSSLKGKPLGDYDFLPIRVQIQETSYGSRLVTKITKL